MSNTKPGVQCTRKPAELLFDREAERAVIGGAICDERCFGLVAHFLRPEHFFISGYRDTYLLCGLLVSHGCSTGPVALLRHLPSSVMGHPTDLFLRTAIAGATTICAVREWAEVVYELAVCRNLAIEAAAQ